MDRVVSRADEQQHGGEVMEKWVREIRTLGQERNQLN